MTVYCQITVVTLNSWFMYNEMIVAAVTNFSGTTTPDKNGEAPVMLQCIAGKMPNRNVLSGTVAMRAGFEVGKTYLVNIREQGFDTTYGPDYTYIKIQELVTGLDIIQACKALGEPQVFYVERPEGFEEVYQRKGDAVESYRSIRMKEGKYLPANRTTIADHSTARETTIGTSIDTGGNLMRELNGSPGTGGDGRRHGNVRPGMDEMNRESGKGGGLGYQGAARGINLSGVHTMDVDDFADAMMQAAGDSDFGSGDDLNTESDTAPKDRNPNTPPTPSTRTNPRGAKSAAAKPAGQAAAKKAAPKKAATKRAASKQADDGDNNA